MCVPVISQSFMRNAFSPLLGIIDAVLIFGKNHQRLACIIHKATNTNEQKSMYKDPSSHLSPIAKLTECLFAARRKSRVTSQPIALGTWQATFLGRSADLFSEISSGQRILMNSAG